MKLYRSSILHLSQCGYHTLQIPQIRLHLSSQVVQEPPPEDFPDDWFWKIKLDYYGPRIAIGK